MIQFGGHKYAAGLTIRPEQYVGFCKRFEKESRKIGFDIIPISTDQDFVEPLLSLFKAREKRN